MMYSFRSLSSVTLALLCAGAGRAMADSLIAGKATITFTLTITQTIGGYKLTNAQLDTDGAKEIYYDGLMNPLNFDSDSAGYNYWSERVNTVVKKQADGEFYPAEKITQVVRKTLVQRYVVADFIKDLIARGGVLSESASDTVAWKGYGLVAVTFKGFDDERRYFFAEKKGKTPVFIGWEKQPEEATALSAGLYLLTEVTPGEAEAGTKKTSQKTVYDTVKLSDFTSVTESFEQPDPTITDTFSGKAPISVRIFPNGTGTFRDLRLGGKVAYSARYAYVLRDGVKVGLYINGASSGSGLAGSQFTTYGEGDVTEEVPEAVVEGTFAVGAEAVLKTDAEAQAYLTQVPESLRPTL